MDGLVAILVVGVITLGIYRLFELFVRKNERMAIIDKVGDKINFSDINVTDFNLPFFGKVKYSSWALKISLMLIGIGLGAITAFTIYYSLLGNYITTNFNDHQIYENLRGAREVIYCSCIAIFGGLGLLIAYIIELKQNKKK